MTRTPAVLSPLPCVRLGSAFAALLLNACTFAPSGAHRAGLERAVQEYDVAKLEELVRAGAKPAEAPALPSLALAEAAQRPGGCPAPQVGRHLESTLRALRANGWGFEEHPKNLPGIRKDLSLAIDALCPGSVVALIAGAVPVGDATRASFLALEVAGRLKVRRDAGALDESARAAFGGIVVELRRFHDGQCPAGSRERSLPPASCRFLDALNADPNVRALL
jgi:hypothetical protein